VGKTTRRRNTLSAGSTMSQIHVKNIEMEGVAKKLLDMWSENDPETPHLVKIEKTIDLVISEQVRKEIRKIVREELQGRDSRPGLNSEDLLDFGIDLTKIS